MKAADERGEQAASSRDSSRTYQPGIGPFAEDRAVAMTVDEMRARKPELYLSLAKRRYPAAADV